MNIAVLMATFNGAGHLTEQLRSVLEQTIPCDILVSDDGSTDNTLSIIDSFRQESDRVQLVFSDRVGGAIPNFSRLCEYALQTDYDCFLLSDQDDVWLPNKIEVLLNAREAVTGADLQSTPCIVLSDVKVVDEELNLIHESFWKSENLNVPNHVDLTTVLPQNFASGCTMLFNRALLEKSLPVPADVIMHDWWFMLVAAVMGKIVVTREPLVLYRQHADNVLGAVPFGLQRILNSISNLQKMKLSLKRTQNQARHLLERCGGELSLETSALLDGYAHLENMNWLKRRVFLYKSGIRKSGLLRNLGMFLLV